MKFDISRKVDHYPITIIYDKYGDTYSKAKWTAWNLDPCEVPEAIYSDDTDCMNFWYTDAPSEYKIGKGDTPEEAYQALIDILGRDKTYEDCLTTD